MGGIEPVAAAERNLRGVDFFLLWGGAAVSLAEIWAGGLLVPLGFLTGLAVIILGHLIGNTPLALGGIIGSRIGIPTMVSVRPSFGVRGSYFAAFLNVIQLVGWTGVMLWIGGKAAQAVSDFPGLGFRGWIIVMGIVTTLWALVGHRFWKWLQRIAVTALLALSALMTYIVLSEYGWSHLIASAPTGGLPFMLGLDLVIAMPISWLPLVSDYSRYARRTGPAFLGTWLGYFLVSSWMYAVGLAAGIATKSPTPDSMVMQLMISWGFLLPALIIVLFSTFTTTFLDIYSAMVSSMNIWPHLNERRGVVFCGVLGTVLALVFPASAYEDFLIVIGSIFIPLFGVVLADYFLRRGRRYAADRFRPGGGNWYPRGVNPWAFVAWAGGFVLYHALQRMTTIGSSVPSLLLAAGLYLLLMRAR